MNLGGAERSDGSVEIILCSRFECGESCENLLLSGFCVYTQQKINEGGIGFGAGLSTSS